MTEQRGGRRPAGKPAGQAPAAIDIFTVKTVEAALTSQAHRAVGYVRRLRQSDPNVSRADILKKLENKFRLDTARSGRAAGAAVSSGVASATVSGTRKETLEAAVFFVLAATEAHDIPLSELEYREDVVRAVLLAKKADWLVHLLASRTAPHLARKIVARIPASSTRRINAVMGDRFVTKYGQSGGIVLEDAVEREVGSALGVATNYAFALHVIRVTRRTLESFELAFDLDAVIVEEDTDETDDIKDKDMPGPVRD